MISLPPERGHIHVWLIKNILISEENVSNDDNDDLPSEDHLRLKIYFKT